MKVNWKVKLISVLKKYAPGVIDFGRAVKKRRKAKHLQRLKKEGKFVRADMLREQLREMGIRKGDSIMVHIALSACGYIDGGADTVVNVLLEAVGPEGNLLMPAFAHQTFSKYYLESAPVFDRLNSPSKAGAVTEAFRRRPGVLRSFHPTDAVCAFGPLADYFTNSHFGQLTPYTKDSPYYKLALKKGKILNIGVPLNTSCTNLHTLEDAVDFKFPIYDKKIFKVKMVDEYGKEHWMETKVHDPVFSEKRRPDELVPLFEKEGVLRHFQFGEAGVMLVDAEKLFECMLRNYRGKGITMYTPHGS